MLEPRLNHKIKLLYVYVSARTYPFMVRQMSCIVVYFKSHTQYYFPICLLYAACIFANWISFHGQTQDAMSSCLQSVWTVQTSAIIAASPSRQNPCGAVSGYEQILGSEELLKCLRLESSRYVQHFKAAGYPTQRDY